MDAMRDDIEVCVFLDDDYITDRYAIEGIARVFSENSEVVGANGQLLADGINCGGISYEAALALLAEHSTPPPEAPKLIDAPLGLYGCNMAFRVSAIGDMRFDENLPLYGWQEDVDFSARIGRAGRLVRTDAFRGVHRGVKSSRLPGVRLGYSQIANPLYLVAKGTMPPAYAARIMIRNILANHAKSLVPEPWVDRLGRARGNWIALAEAAVGRADPRRVLQL
jgi:GT2 family glycosyltransferase